jgi:hypothetical protein
MDFIEFPKIARLSRDIVITEKLDGTNAQVLIMPDDTGGVAYSGAADERVATVGNYLVFAGSRSRWVTPEQDNYGFAAWVREHAYELFDALGEGQHFGEWWGRGIQRNYSQTERHFSLFNTKRWGTHYNDKGRVGPCRVVPTLYKGPLEDHGVMKGLRFAMTQLQNGGSAAAPGFMKPEGVVIYHPQGNVLFKKTLEKDEEPKSKASALGELLTMPFPTRDQLEKMAQQVADDEWPGATQAAEGGR